jgi:glycosyltransferase involved in cell wall biosynthesis
MDDDTNVDTDNPVIFAISTSEVGGAQRSLVRLLEGLDRQAYPPFVLLGEDGPLATSLAALGVRYEISPFRFRTARGVRHFVRVARRERARVLHLYAPRTLAIAARALGMAVVERVNVLRGPEAGGFVKRPFVDRTLLRLPHRVIVPSRAMQSQLLARGVPESRVRLVENGIRLAPAAMTRADVRAALDLPADACVLLCVGRLSPIKGQDVLIEAARRVMTPDPIVVVLAGEGRLRTCLAAAARAAGVDVRLLGNRDDVPNLLAACDIYVQPSRSEASGQALVEAMLAARAVVATDTGGTPEVVRDGETGLLVPVMDPDALATAIETLARKPALRRAMGIRARTFAQTLTTPEASCRATEAVYQEALACR